MKHLFLLFFVLTLLLNATDTHAQNKADSYTGVWRKKNVHKVYIDTSRLGSAVWIAFFKGMMRSVENKTLPVYEADNKNIPFTAKDIKDFTSMVNIEPDTAVVDSPGSHEQYIRITNREFDYGNIRQLAITEEWVYDPATSRTSIQITGIGPRLDVYSDDGTYRGTTTLFSIDWKDLKQYSEKQLPANMINNIAQVIWEDYFRDTLIKKDSSKISTDVESDMKCTILRTISLHYNMPPTTYIPNFESEYDTSIAQLIFDAAMGEKIRAYTDLRPDKRKYLTHSEIKQKLSTPDDTIIVRDPITGKDTLVVVHHDICFECVRKYSVQEEWRFSIKEGLSEISYLQIELVKDSLDDAQNFVCSVPLFWVRYSEAKKALQRYNEYNPDYSIEWQIWNDRFKEPIHRRVEQLIAPPTHP